jgi:hypothetical protein
MFRCKGDYFSRAHGLHVVAFLRRKLSHAIPYAARMTEGGMPAPANCRITAITTTSPPTSWTQNER